jgi:hypothetical protein
MGDVHLRAVTGRDEHELGVRKRMEQMMRRIAQLTFTEGEFLTHLQWHGSVIGTQ